MLTIKQIKQGTEKSSVVDECEFLELQDRIRNTLAVLNEPQQAIIKKRFAIDSESMTREQCGQQLGLTAEEVRRIESHAMLRLQSQLRHMLECFK